MRRLRSLLSLKLIRTVSSSVHGLEEGEHLALVSLLDHHRLVHLAASSQAFPPVLFSFLLSHRSHLIELEVSLALVQKATLRVPEVIHESSFHAQLLRRSLSLLLHDP